MIDIFAAELRCPSCGAVAAASADTGMQTYLRSYPDGSTLGIGFELDARDLTSERIQGSGYLLIAEPRPGDPIRLLDVWACPACEKEQWAIVTIVERRIASIEAIRLTPAVLAGAHFISEANAPSFVTQA